MSEVTPCFRSTTRPRASWPGWRARRFRSARARKDLPSSARDRLLRCADSDGAPEGPCAQGYDWTSIPIARPCCMCVITRTTRARLSVRIAEYARCCAAARLVKRRRRNCRSAFTRRALRHRHHLCWRRHACAARIRGRDSEVVRPWRDDAAQRPSSRRNNEVEPTAHIQHVACRRRAC